MVGQPHEEMEWENPLEEQDRPGNRLRRIPQGMGSSLPGPEDWRSLVSIGREHAHQLSGAVTMAVQTFTKDLRGLSVLLRIDNTS